ncbi:MAG: glycosyltransferase [Pseudomonadota bacterium]|nr:glycosyltransferase [Pseudomonadota bacterium]
MKISIVFATHNGSYTIDRVLTSYKLLVCPPNFSWEIIVVDNNSTDNTWEILESFKKELPIKLLKEPKAGKNSALNKALHEPLGDIIIFTDDDVLPHENWLVAYAELFEEQPEFNLFGGRILPYWEAAPPNGLLEAIPVHVAFALTAESEKTGPIKAGKIYGPNMAVRKEVFTQGLRFNEMIGPSGKNYIMGSETDFLQRAEQEGHKAYFSLSSTVQHIIRPWQYEKKWLKNRAFKFGRAIVHDQKRHKNLAEHSLFFGYPRWGLPKLVELYFQVCLACLRNDSFKKYQKNWEYNMNKGFLSEYKKWVMH